MKDRENYFGLNDIKEIIGKEQKLTEHEAYLSKCPIDISEFRRYALAVEDCNPLWFEQEYAKKTRWKGIVAPPTFMHTCGGGSAGHIHIPGTDEWPHGNLYAGSEFEYLIPIREGDILTPRSTIQNIKEKTGRSVGPMVLLMTETKYINQKGELTGIWRQSIIKYRTKEAQKRGNYMSEELGPMIPDGYPQMTKGDNTSRGSETLFYEDVKPGDQIPPLVRYLSIPKIVCTGDAVRIGIILPHTLPGPGCYWHYMPGESEKLRGLPAPMDDGPIRAAQPSQLLTDWMGDDGWLRKLVVQIRRPIFAGDTTTWSGEVVNKDMREDDHIVGCEIFGRNQRGQISTTGTAEVILPSRL